MSSTLRIRPAEVLLAEDNPGDVYLALEGFEQAQAAVNLHHVENGEKCLAFLRKEGIYAGAPTPHLVILDINMPKMSGHEVLAEMMADSNLRQLPVIALSTSARDDDVARMYDLGCNSYFVKPAGLEATLKLYQAISDYWFKVAALPATS